MQNRKGFTLVEVLVAFSIILIGMLALLQAVNLAYEHNFKNQQREEATRVADDIMSSMRAQPFLTAFNPITSVPSKKNKMKKNNKYAVVRKVDNMASGSKRYEVRVRWAYKGYTTDHAIVTVRGVP